MTISPPRFPMMMIFTSSLLLVLMPSSIIALVTKSSSLSSSSNPSNRIRHRNEVMKLNVLPPLIIGPIIKKMKEEKAKKNAPMVTDEDMKGQAPGLRVGTSTWKWPPVWPYDQTFFTPKEDVQTPQNTQQNMMTGMLTGTPENSIPDPAEATKIEKLDPVQYWQVEKANVTTGLDEEAIEQLQNHYDFYLEDGMRILELGAAESSYLPKNLKLARHVGVSLSEKLMGKNPSLTETVVVDLNKVVDQQGVDSDEFRRLAAEPFDAIIMANTADFLMHPREVYKSAWFLLKPGGTMINAFSSTKAAYAEKFERAQTVMWRDYNDDQHMWVAGSFFQFSAGDGWENLMGFDISPESAGDNFEKKGPLDMLNFGGKGKDNNIYVVQATKGFPDETIDEKNPSKAINSKMWMLPTLEERDKQLVVPRLGRSYASAKNPKRKDAIKNHIVLLPKIYEALIKMDQFSFTFEMQSQLAADLILDPDFDGNDDQIIALKEGLGLRTPSPNFWGPVGELTGDMVINDKINLLAYLVPRFGSGRAEQETALLAYASGLKPTFAAIRSKCPNLSDSDVQLLGTELLCAEILIPGTSTREEFASWIGSMTEGDMEKILATRKKLNDESNSELLAYKEQQEEEEKERVEIRKRYEEQLAEARKVRSIVFNPMSGQFQEFKKK